MPEIQKQGNMQNHAQEEQDEINLLDLLIVLLKYKKMIVAVVFLAGLVTLVVSLLLPNVYRSEALIVPIEQEKGVGGGALSALSAMGGLGGMIASEVGLGGSGSLEKFEVVLKSRELTNIVVQKYNLLPVIFAEDWDKKKNQWKTDEPPTLQDAYKAIDDKLLLIQTDIKKKTLAISFDHTDPAIAQQLLWYYITELSNNMSKQAGENADAQQKYLSEQMTKATDPLIQAKIAGLISQQIEKEMLAKVQKYYGFDIIDPPFAPEKKFKPKRALMCVLAVIIAFFLAVFLAFSLEYIGNLKQHEEPERLARLKRYISFKKYPPDAPSGK